MLFKKTPAKKFLDIYFRDTSRVKEFFKKPPKHKLVLGDLVTCTCHGGVAIVIELYDKGEVAQMNMAKIWWIVYPHTGIKERDWMHTIDRLYKFNTIRRLYEL